jgi:HK97 family phage prohead protease
MSLFKKAVTSTIDVTEPGEFRGYVAKYLNIDRQGHIMLPGAHAKILPKILDEGAPILVDHENRTRSVIGTLSSADESMDGLLIASRFSATNIAQETRRMMAEKAVTQMSEQFYGKSKKYNEKQVQSLWANYGYQPSERQKDMAKSGAIVITEVTDVVDFSVVAVPANPEARIIAVKSFDGDHKSPVTVAPRIDLAALAQRANLADKFWPLSAVRKG